MKSPITHQFKDQVVVITGASGVLGACFAKEFALAGAKVALLVRNVEKAASIEKAIIQAGGQAKAYFCDVLDKPSIQASRDAIYKDFGTCDILINCAGGNHPSATTGNEYHELEGLEEVKTFFDLDQTGIESVFNLNFLGTLLPVQIFAKDMIGKKGANIINISSMNAFTPLTKIPAYSGAKAAISNFTQWLAVHFSHVGIRVNAIAPGFLVSNQNKALLFNEDGTPTARAHKILNSTPMGRFGEPEELIGGLMFLADENSASFVNGIVLPIDGGFSAYSGV
jgi:NAD(P)-dependent dehydrogenase (short-subunit alcohol dehydrogenase family)